MRDSCQFCARKHHLHYKKKRLILQLKKIQTPQPHTPSHEAITLFTTSKFAGLIYRSYKWIAVFPLVLFYSRCMWWAYCGFFVSRYLEIIITFSTMRWRRGLYQSTVKHTIVSNQNHRYVWNIGARLLYEPIPPDFTPTNSKVTFKHFWQTTVTKTDEVTGNFKCQRMWKYKRITDCENEE